MKNVKTETAKKILIKYANKRNTQIDTKTNCQKVLFPNKNKECTKMYNHIIGIYYGWVKNKIEIYSLRTNPVRINLCPSTRYKITTCFKPNRTRHIIKIMS